MSTNNYDPSNNELAIGCGVAIVFTPIVWFVEGFTLNTLWGWFLTPLFEMKPPGILACLGLSILVSLFTRHINQDRKIIGGERETYIENLNRIVGETIFTPLFCLLVGYIIHLLSI